MQNPSGDLLIASDLPLQGAGRAQTVQMTKAIRYVFTNLNWKAGKYTIAYQSCDDSTAQAGKWDSATCQSNATNYAADSSVVAEIGTFNSGCAEIEIPIDNRAPNGPLAMVSPANTYVGLTHAGPGTQPASPGSTTRRVSGTTPASSQLTTSRVLLTPRSLSSLKVTKLFILNDKEAYGQGVATNTKNAAGKLGIKVVKYTAYDPKATSYSSLALQIKSSGAQAVFIGGLICENGGKLIKDIHTGAPNVKILLPDGFTPGRQRGPAVGWREGHVHLGRRPAELGSSRPAGQQFVKKFQAWVGGAAVHPYSVYAGAGRRGWSWRRSRLPTAPVPAWRRSCSRSTSPNGHPRHDRRSTPTAT